MTWGGPFEASVFVRSFWWCWLFYKLHIRLTWTAARTCTQNLAVIFVYSFNGHILCKLEIPCIQPMSTNRESQKGSSWLAMNSWVPSTLRIEVPHSLAMLRSNSTTVRRISQYYEVDWICYFVVLLLIPWASQFYDIWTVIAVPWTIGPVTYISFNRTQVNSMNDQYSAFWKTSWSTILTLFISFCITASDETYIRNSHKIRRMLNSPETIWGCCIIDFGYLQ